MNPPAACAPVVAVGAIAVDGGDLLLIKRGTDPQAGRWSIPGGRVEPGETVAAAVEREVHEETGLAVRCGVMLGWAERIAPDHHFVILDFTVELVGRRDPVPGGDAVAVTWTALADVPGVDLVDGLQEFLRDHGVLR
jgi:8-oxo-dGTP diphosphatase